MCAAVWGGCVRNVCDVSGGCDVCWCGCGGVGDAVEGVWGSRGSDGGGVKLCGWCLWGAAGCVVWRVWAVLK